MKDKNIVVLMGGPSEEREVSLNTGKAILAALQEKNYRAVGVDLDPAKLVEQLSTAHCDIVFNAVHGKYGEDGILQGTLELLGIPYTGSGVLASAMAMDKSVSKQMFLAAGLTTPRAHVYTKHDQKLDLVQEISQEFSLPVVIKAAAQGSSIGVSIVEQASAIAAALKDAFAYSDSIVVEEFIKGRELTVAVWGTDEAVALPVIEIAPHSGKYDYHSKYTKGATDYLVPAPLDAKVTAAAQAVAVKAFQLLGCAGIARVDMMLGENNVPYVLEVNSIPGMTATSLVPKAAKSMGIEFPELCEKLLHMVKLNVK